MVNVNSKHVLVLCLLTTEISCGSQRWYCTDNDPSNRCQLLKQVRRILPLEIVNADDECTLNHRRRP